MLDVDGQRAQRVECFEQLYIADPLNRQLPTGGLQVADSPINNTHYLLMMSEIVARLRGRGASDILNISVKLLEDEGEAKVLRLYAILTAMWQSGAIHLDYKRRLVLFLLRPSAPVASPCLFSTSSAITGTSSNSVRFYKAHC